jgi:hypothetical protein
MFESLFNNKASLTNKRWLIKLTSSKKSSKNCKFDRQTDRLSKTTLKKEKEKKNYRNHPTQADAERETMRVLQELTEKHKYSIKRRRRRKKLNQSFTDDTDGETASL